MRITDSIRSQSFAVLQFALLQFTFPTSLLLLCVCLLITSCGSSQSFIDKGFESWNDIQLPDKETQVHRVFLVGNTGAAAASYAALDLLQKMATEAGPKSTTLFLGDQIPCCGLPDSGSVKREALEVVLQRQLDAVKDVPGNLFFIAGDNDWDGSRGSLSERRNQELFIEQYLDRGNVFLPDNGFPGPKMVELEDDLYLMLLDTQWWLSDGEKAFGDAGSYDLEEASDFLQEIEEKLYKHRNDKLLIAGHHPFYSNGAHGGHFSAKSHLTPLPIFGSLEPLYRRYIGNNQDLAHHSYGLLKEELLKRFEEKELVFAAAHDHSLQYFPKGTNRARRHFIVSGSGTQGTHVASGRGAGFVSEDVGFMVLDYYEDNSIWLTAWSASTENPAGKVLFKHPIQPPAPAPITEDTPVIAEQDLPSFKDSTLVIAANPEYDDASGLKRFVRGNLHRELWGTPVRVPVLDLGTEAGGLTPIKMGGRGQSISLRVENPAGRQFVLRSVDKVAGKAWAPELQSSFLRNLIQDQMSMLHPYSAFVLPPLAEAAGVFHTNPKLFYVPDDPRLGLSREQLAGKLVLFEERPDEDMSDVFGMGGADNVISSFKLFEKIEDDNDHRVDGRAFARARLFDMLINDWDRHPDQWRWGAFEPADSLGKIYRPIPRDRDVAFSIVDGIVPTLSKIFFDPKFQEFEDSYGYIKGLNKNGLALDRRFTAELIRSDWIEIADSIMTALTDEVIEDAIKLWPAPIFEKDGLRTIDILKSRRDQLNAVAVEYFKTVLAPTVDIVGTHKHERFEVKRVSDLETVVVVYKTNKEGEIRKELFRRTFQHAETREIRLYGLDGKDQFYVKGKVNEGLFIIAVGGPGVDHFVDSSVVTGSRKFTRFYDTESNNTFETSNETKVFKSDEPANNAYDFLGHKYDLKRPIAFFGSNKDDGLLLGGGIRITKHRFRKSPHAQLHMLRANAALNAHSFNVVYEGLFTSVISDWDFAITADIRSPNTIRNFYGFGNETISSGREESFFRARYGQVDLKSALQKNLDQGAVFRIGPKVFYTNVEQDTSRFIGQPANLDTIPFEGRWHSGIEASLALQSVDNTLNPRQGFRFNSVVDVNLGLSKNTEAYVNLASSISLYLSPNLSRQVTLALRLGGAHVLGDFPFFAGATLGSKTSLRGFVSSRFTGRSAFYQNAELRIELARFKTYIAAGAFGITGFIDNGRVWYDDEKSSTWHQGYGGGLWFGLFDRVVISSALGLSKEDNTLNVKLGFMY
ncbi:MAG: BamA/TamA family outer membrane protein [Rhodothermales bacterium]